MPTFSRTETMSDIPKNYMTPQGHKALQDELYTLVNKERPEIVQIVNWAAGNGAEQTVRIVGEDEIDAARNKISWKSPLARALIKAREGDTVWLDTPVGREQIEILSVEYVRMD